MSHHYGYGLLDAGLLVDLARVWLPTKPQKKCAIRVVHTPTPILPRMLVPKNVTACSDGSRRRLIRSLEHVQVQLSLSYSRRGDLEIFLTSPMGTRSTLVAIRCETSQRVLRASGALPSLPRWDPIWVGLRRLV